MTMFSMKPKFDLAEFLAAPAPAAAAKARAARRRGIKFQTAGKSEEAVTSSPAETAEPADKL
ncbi:hypothetical protein LX81_00551 [Palleronia aestuarii]|uniref:Uncharacterized protein n=1 Tax=Palleronia aestuarii TaxID=568105 RepID=A0A2W7NF77_9RHOB|nr:hypothetical protein [Palleronia aestuarii]PZX18858.1 hypothetical protein LX81_00551 [Palleronia aestuarii]